jgi:hypothetical protein
MTDYITKQEYLNRDGITQWEIQEALQDDARRYAEWRKANPEEAAKLDAENAKAKAEREAREAIYADIDIPF